MIADYIASKIDNLFSEKLTKQQPSQLAKKGSQFQPKSYFNRDTIKHHLPNVICKQEVSRSPVRRKEHSASPISKSRLKGVLENNRNQNIKAVIRRDQQETSPFKTFQL